MREAAIDVLIVLTNLPDRASAVKLAQTLIDKRLAACVNVLGEACSIYRWKGQIATEAEVPVLIKTRSALYGELEAAIVAVHPYEVPEIVAVPVVRGLPKYLEWVVGETVPD
jgi:periplasmic divalent cation tolerance protein